MRNATELLNQIIFWWSLSCYVIGSESYDSRLLLCGIPVIILVMACGWIQKKRRILPTFLKEPGYFYLIIQIFCCILNWNYDRPQMIWNLNLSAFFAALILKIFYDNLKWTDKFIQSRVSTTHLDEYRLKRLNLGISLAYAGGVGILLLLAGMLPVSISPIIRALGRFFAMITSGLSGEVLPELEEERIEEEMIFPNESSGEMGWIWKVLEKFIEVAGIILAVLGVLLFIIYIIKMVKRHFHREQEIAVTNDDTIKDIVEKLDRRKEFSKTGQKYKVSIFDRSPGMHIRKIYRKAIKSLRLNVDMGLLCPKEQVEHLAEQKSFVKERQQEITKLYEKARYGKAPVTEQEAKQMKELIFSGKGEKL